MIRKLLTVAAAAAVPISAVAAAGVVGTSQAGAATVPVLTPATCHLTGTINFMAPGISLVGTATASKTTVTTSSTTITSCSGGGTIGGGGALVITTKNTKCVLPVTSSEPSNCAKGLDVSNSGSGLASPTTTKSIEKAIKKLPVTLTEGGVTYNVKHKATGVSNPIGGVCTNGATQEVGFAITGTAKTSPKSTGLTAIDLTVCLGVDNLGGNFFSDLTGGKTIASTAIDGVTSTETIH
jgi:hypothetical protein